MAERYRYMVALQCMTYNHASYIEETLQGFAMQETSFPVVYLVVDDASTDGEQEFLKNWAEDHLQADNGRPLWEQVSYGSLAQARLKEKSQLNFVILLLKENHHQAGRHYQKLNYIAEWLNDSKYHAICEGDDFWISPEKLALQVDFLEKHPEYVMCHTDFDLTTGNYRNHKIYQSPDDYYFPQSILGDLGIGTLTTLYRADVYDRLPQLWRVNGWPMGDHPLWIELSHEGKIKFLRQVTARYRLLPDSASHGNLEKELCFLDAIKEVREYYARYYNVSMPPDGLSRRYFIDTMRAAFRHKNPVVAKQYKNLAKEKKMTSGKMWVYYYATVISPLGGFLRKFLKR